jgi:predicted CopG family antitoxin
MMSTIISNRSHKTIVVSRENYNELKKLGQVGDSFDDVIGVLLSKMVLLERNEEFKVDV